jgi:hypothetical protein
MASSQGRKALEVFGNLSRYHREHEKYYGEAPLQDASALLRTSRSLKALADRWATTAPASAPVPSPFAGATDLNSETAIETSGILFMESGEAPAEIARIRRDLEIAAEDAEATGTWLASAMEAAWKVAEGLLDFPELADLLGERHSIIARDWQNATMLLLISRQLRRANAILARVDFTAAALRADLAEERHAVDLVFSTAELIDQAADLMVESSTLVRQNERRWRVFHERLGALACDRAS